MTQATITPIKSEPTDAAKAQRRMVYMALEDAYDEAGKHYKPTHTDETVAKVVGCAIQLVSKVRDEFFGPNGPPDEIAAIKLEVVALGRELAALNEKISATYKRNGWA